jgi:NitT/TauT family transport system substrate-binding protein
MTSTFINRRSFLRSSAAVVGAAAAAPLLASCGGGSKASGAGAQKLTLQGGWLLSEGQLGEAVALAKGWYDDAGISFTFKPGGPSIDGVSLVGSGQSLVGQVSSSPSLMLAASQGVPVKAFAVGVQRQPYAYVSKPDKPVKEPKDLIGKTVGTQATGQILLDALLKVNDIDPKDVKVVIIGSEITPLTTGQVDVWTGWMTNVAAMRPLHGQYETMSLWDAGVKLYGYPYYARADTLKDQSDLLARFTKATAKGWAYAAENLPQAARDVTKMDPSLKAEDIEAAGKVLLPFAFNEETATNGWGAMDPAVWKQQIDLYDRLGQFKGHTPTLDDVVDMSVLEATAGDRPKIGA